MVQNIIPYIGGEEEKSEQEPLRVLGKVENGQIVKAEAPKITCQCCLLYTSSIGKKLWLWYDCRYSGRK